MKDQVLTPDQCQELISLEMNMSHASCCWCRVPIPSREGYEWVLLPEPLGKNDKDYIPTFTLQDILERLPKTIIKNNDRCYLSLFAQGDCWVSSYNCCGFEGDYSVEEQYGSTPLEAVFNMLKWCKQNNYLNNKS